MSDSTNFDRSKPLYRLFDMEDGTNRWFVVNADNTPGRPASELEVVAIEAILDKSDWRGDFYAAFEKNKKATIYAQIPDPDRPYVVPDGCDGLLRRHAIRSDWGERIAYGYIYGDRKGRFPDGAHIHTSKIISGPDENGVIRTRNSVYALEKDVA